MKTAILAARVLLGVIFVVFGLNGFLQFLPQPAMPEAAIAFFGALAATGYMLPQLFAWQVAGGALVLSGRVALGVLILTPVIINIVAFHLVLAPGGLGLAFVVTALALFLAWTHREAYRPLFADSKAEVVVAAERRAMA